MVPFVILIVVAMLAAAIMIPVPIIVVIAMMFVPTAMQSTVVVTITVLIFIAVTIPEQCSGAKPPRRSRHSTSGDRHFAALIFATPFLTRLLREMIKDRTGGERAAKVSANYDERNKYILFAGRGLRFRGCGNAQRGLPYSGWVHRGGLTLRRSRGSL